MLHVSVTDTGIGVPEDKRAAIFDAFTQADSSTSRRFGGTGLGLTITSQLVSLLGGRIWLESTTGEGSTFHVTLPAPCVAEPDATAAWSGPEQPTVPLLESGPLTALRVLVAEDNAINRAVARGLLEKRGHIVTLAGNGIEAVAAAAGTTFDTILMDVQMPEMDGLEATAAIRAAAPRTGPSVRIVALTAHARDEDRRRCLDAGMDDYLSKPYGAEELFRAIEAGARTPPLPDASGAGTLHHAAREF
jgi:CheY-like chemotaxis protein